MIILSGGFSVLQPDPGLLLWTTLIFLLFWLIVGRAAFRPIANALKKRGRDIQASLDEAKKAREEMANLKSENEDLLAQARDERTKIIKEAKEVKENLIAKAKVEAKEEAKKIVANAKQEIEHLKFEAMIDLKNQVGLMSLEIAEKVLRKNLAGDPEQERFVKKLVDDFETN